MVAVRVLKILAPLALLAGLATACGSGSGSSAGGGPTSPGGTTGTPTAGNQLELRPVYARYATGVPLGPQVPQDLLDAMSSQSCPMRPTVLQGMVMECDPGKTVFLLQDPLVTGDVAQAAVKQIRHQKLYYLRLTLVPTAAATLNAASPKLEGTELAFCYGGRVLTSEIVDQNFDASHLVITGNYDKKQATQLASEITS
jgi:hypothetical protein